MSLVQCHLVYACISWYYNLTNNLKHKLQVLQNKMVRFILDKGNREHIGQTEFIQINCTNIDNRVKQIGLNIVHKLYYLKKPEYLLCNFIRTNNSHSHNTRNFLLILKFLCLQTILLCPILFHIIWLKLGMSYQMI